MTEDAVPRNLRLGLGANWEQFTLLVVVNGFVGAMIGLVGPARRGLAMGLNETAGYAGVALASLATGYLAAAYGPRPAPFLVGISFALLGLLLTLFLVRETHEYAKLEAKQWSTSPEKTTDKPSAREIFMRTSFTDRNLSSASQAGFVNNLNDGMAWGLLPLFFAASGMWLQSGGILLTAATGSFRWWLIGAVLMGLGTAFVYPTLLAAISDVAHPSWRASSVGVYRLWRDSSYAVVAILAGVVADLFGFAPAIVVVGILTAISGLVVAARMRESLPQGQGLQ